jgi:hypothetical protein
MIAGFMQTRTRKKKLSKENKENCDRHNTSFWGKIK